MYIITMKKEVLNLNRAGRGNMGRFGGIKEVEKFCD